MDFIRGNGLYWLLVPVGGVIGGVISYFVLIFFVSRGMIRGITGQSMSVLLLGTIIFGVGVGSLIVGGLFGELLRVFVVAAGFCLGAFLGVLVALLTIENPGGLAGLIQFIGMIGYGGLWYTVGEPKEDCYE